MESNQKFKTGDRVKILIGSPAWSNKDGNFDMLPYLVGKKATIEYTYNEKYGNNQEVHKVDEYSIKIDGIGSISWFYNEQLELIND